jgi:sugar/nucleoside kinase (ribokinase family)
MVARLIDSARSRVFVAVYSFKNRWIAEALIRAHRRGIEVKVVLDASQARAGGPQYWDLWLSGIDVRTLWDARPMRYSFAVIDDDIVIVSSYSFSRAEEVRERCGPSGGGGETLFGRVREVVGSHQMRQHRESHINRIEGGMAN